MACDSESLSESALVESGNVCCHRWRVETPNGSKSEGICQKCGKVKMFVNYIAEYGNSFLYENEGKYG